MDFLTIEWRCFLAAARLGSVSRAADELHLPQSSVTKYLQRLERDVGKPLFRRSNRGLHSSEVGQRLYAQLGPLHAQLQQGLRGALNAAEEISGRVRLGSHHILALNYVTDHLAKLYREHPKLRFELSFITSLEVSRQVASGSLDYGLVANPLPLPGLVIKKYREEDVAIFSTRPTTLKDLHRVFYNPEMQLLPRILRQLRGISLESLADYDVLAQLATQVPRAGAVLPEGVAQRFGLKHRVTSTYYRANIALIFSAQSRSHATARHRAILKEFSL